MNERPFFLAPTARTPDNNIDNITATLGGPIVKRPLALLRGLRVRDQDLRDAIRVIQQSAIDNAGRLGLSPTAIPAGRCHPHQQHVNFAIAKTDYQLSPEHKLSARYVFFKNFSPYNIGGGLNTVDRATDFNDRMDSVSVQLISSFGVDPPQRAARAVRAPPPVPHAERERGGLPVHRGQRDRELRLPAGRGRRARASTSTRRSGRSPTTSPGCGARHSVKAGFDLQFVGDERVNTLRQIYTFPSVDAYLAAPAMARTASPTPTS